MRRRHDAGHGYADFVAGRISPPLWHGYAGGECAVAVPGRSPHAVSGREGGGCGGGTPGHTIRVGGAPSPVQRGDAPQLPSPHTTPTKTKTRARPGTRRELSRRWRLRSRTTTPSTTLPNFLLHGARSSMFRK